MKVTILVSLLMLFTFSVFAHPTSHPTSFEKQPEENLTSSRCEQIKEAAENLLYNEDFYSASIIDEYRENLSRDFQNTLGMTTPEVLGQKNKEILMEDDLVRCFHFASNYLSALEAKEVFYIRKLDDINNYFQRFDYNNFDKDQYARKLNELAKANRVLNLLADFKDEWSSRDAFRMEFRDYLREKKIMVEWL
ncbi:MAG: hypothetical protein OXB84_06530 [Halobacteriovoraceae bacterium]|nr:hypothetical protein [Halobacteriovoraceae bacterium]